MEIAGYIASLLIGISLGLVGGGGSIITIPVLVYLFHVEPVLATVYALFVVGVTSLVGTWPKYFKGYVHLKTAWLFGLPSIVAVLITRRLILPYVPSQLFRIGDIVITKSFMMMMLFVVLMIFASIVMIRNGSKTAVKAVVAGKTALITRGAMVGAITGLVGVGGGFLIIPSLVLLLGLSMKDAVGTSLFIISLNALLGFVGDLQHYTINWNLLLVVTGLATLGVLLGNSLSEKVEAESLKKGFGWFLLAMGVYIIFREVGFMLK